MTKPYSDYKEARDTKSNDLYTKALKYYITKLDELIENNALDISKSEVSVQLTPSWTPSSNIEISVGLALADHYKKHGYKVKYCSDNGKVVITF